MNLQQSLFEKLTVLPERRSPMKAKALLLALTIVLLAATPTRGENRLSLALGSRSWISSGYTEFSLNNLLVNPASDLVWRGTDSLVFEVNAEARWRRLLALAAVGVGDVTDGAFLDDDFLLDRRQGRFSHSRSVADAGGLFYATLDVGARLLSWGQAGRLGAGSLDGFVGYQYWREEYEASGLKGALALGDVALPNRTRVITQTSVWQALRVGARSEVALGYGLTLRATAVLLPIGWWRWEDVHHLRGDLRQDPSVSAASDDAYGVELDGGLRWHVWGGLSLEGGYRYWGMDSNGGDVRLRGLEETPRLKVHEATSERHGPYVGLQWRF